MIRRPPRSTHCISSAASDVYKRQADGTEFTQSNSWSNSCPVLYPGRTVDCTFVFEMPQDKIDNATLRVLASWDHMAPRVVVKLEKPLVEGEIVREGVTV